MQINYDQLEKAHPLVDAPNQCLVSTGAIAIFNMDEMAIWVRQRAIMASPAEQCLWCHCP